MKDKTGQEGTQRPNQKTKEGQSTVRTRTEEEQSKNIGGADEGQKQVRARTRETYRQERGALLDACGTTTTTSKQSRLRR